jgi:hypothetical protein
MQQMSSGGGLRVAFRLSDSTEGTPSIVAWWQLGTDMSLEVKSTRQRLWNRGPSFRSVRPSVETLWRRDDGMM